MVHRVYYRSEIEVPSGAPDHWIDAWAQYTCPQLEKPVSIDVVGWMVEAREALTRECGLS